MDTGRAGREGREERADEQSGQGGGPPRSSSHNSHRSRAWMEAHVQDRQTDRQTCTLRPPGGPSQPVLWGIETVHLSTLGGSPPSLGAHDLPGPRLVGSVWGQLGEHHLHGLELLVLGWDGAHLVGHLVTLHGDVVPLDAGGRKGASANGRPHSLAPLQPGLRMA